MSGHVLGRPPLALKIASSHVGFGSPSNTWFLGPTQVEIANDNSIGSAVVAGITIVTDRQTSRLVFTSRLRPRSECPQFGMPAERRAQFRVPNVPRSRISERAPFQIYEDSQCRVFERTSLQSAYVIPCRQQMGSSAVLRARRSALVLAASTRCLWRAHGIGRGCRVQTNSAENKGLSGLQSGQQTD